MARAMSAGRVLRGLVDSGAVPPEAAAAGRSALTWSAGELAYALVVFRYAGEDLGWTLFVSDAALSPRFEKFGGVSVPVVSTAAYPSWPATPSDPTLERLEVLVRSARAFVVDRADLARLLAEPDGEVRGDLRTHPILLSSNNFPARLVQATLLARELGDDPLEARIGVLLDTGTWSGADAEPLREAAGRWAARFAREVGVDVPLP